MPSELHQSSLPEEASIIDRACQRLIEVALPTREISAESVRHLFSKLNPEMLYRQIQYLVEEDDWARQGEEVQVPLKTEEQGT